MHDAVPEADFVIINPGGLRTQWYPGVIQYQHLYNMFPFTNYLISFDITGAELMQMLAVVQAGPLGFYPMFGVTQVVGIDRQNNHRFISATLADGSPIDPEKTYRGLTIDFLINGGDDFNQVINKTYTPRNTIKHEGVIRDIIRKPL
jgi:2',3'-cyclic-nucleotide 2'-phosphodiesterase (5'-nucleotidase family)